VKWGENDARRKEPHLTTAGPRLALLKELNAQIVSGIGNPAAQVNGAAQAPVHAHRTISARRSVGKRH
jgi:hypothetical protein